MPRLFPLSKINKSVCVCVSALYFAMFGRIVCSYCSAVVQIFPSLIYIITTDIRSAFSPPPLTPVMGSGSIEMLAPRERHRSGDSFQFTTMRSGLKNGLFKQNVLSVTQFTRQQVCLLQHVH